MDAQTAYDVHLCYTMSWRDIRSHTPVTHARQAALAFGSGEYLLAYYAPAPTPAAANVRFILFDFVCLLQCSVRSLQKGRECRGGVDAEEWQKKWCDIVARIVQRESNIPWNLKYLHFAANPYFSRSYFVRNVNPIGFFSFFLFRPSSSGRNLRGHGECVNCQCV